MAFASLPALSGGSVPISAEVPECVAGPTGRRGWDAAWLAEVVAVRGLIRGWREA
jgi:hypothetical protein